MIMLRILCFFLSTDVSAVRRQLVEKLLICLRRGLT